MSPIVNVIPQFQNEENVAPMNPFSEPAVDASPVKNNDSSHQVQQNSSKITESPKQVEDGDLMNLPPKMIPIWTGGIRGSARVATKMSKLEELIRSRPEKETLQMKPSMSVISPPTPAPEIRPRKVLPVWTGGVRGSTRVAERKSVLELKVEKQRKKEKTANKIPKICEKCAEAKRNERKSSPPTPSDAVERIRKRPAPDFSDSTRWIKIKLPEGVENLVIGSDGLSEWSSTYFILILCELLIAIKDDQNSACVTETTEMIRDGDKEQFLHDLNQFPVASKPFMGVFVAGEEKLFTGKKLDLHIHEDGSNFEEKLEGLRDIHLFKNPEGLEMEIPEDLNLTTLMDFLPQIKVGVINSYTRGTENKEFSEMVRLINQKEEREVAWNLLNFEMSHTDCRIAKDFKEPLFVRKNSIVNCLEERLKEELHVIENQLPVIYHHRHFFNKCSEVNTKLFPIIIPLKYFISTISSYF